MIKDVEVIGREARKVFAGHKEIKAAYLYGSAARGDTYKGSDIDIGVLLSRDYVPDALYSSRLSAELDRVLEGDADVRVLNGAGIIFLHQVLKYGVLIFSRSEKVRVSFETSVYSKYLDYKYFYDEYNTIRRARLLHDGQ